MCAHFSITHPVNTVWKCVLDCIFLFASLTSSHSYRSTTYASLTEELRVWTPIGGGATILVDFALSITVCVLLKRGSPRHSRDRSAILAERCRTGDLIIVLHSACKITDRTRSVVNQIVRLGRPCHEWPPESDSLPDHLYRGNRPRDLCLHCGYHACGAYARSLRALSLYASCVTVPARPEDFCRHGALLHCRAL
jgi:hypothetical protein